MIEYSNEAIGPRFHHRVFSSSPKHAPNIFSNFLRSYFKYTQQTEILKEFGSMSFWHDFCFLVRLGYFSRVNYLPRYLLYPYTIGHNIM